MGATARVLGGQDSTAYDAEEIEVRFIMIIFVRQARNLYGEELSWCAWRDRPVVEQELQAGLLKMKLRHQLPSC